MKEKDFEKCLDNLIIAGLIKEAEQDNADFEAAMRNISNEDFLSLIYEGATKEDAASFEPKSETPVYNHLMSDDLIPLGAEPMFSRAPIRMSERKQEEISKCIADGFTEHKIAKPESKPSNWKLWVGAIASAAAILLIVLIPAVHSMDAKLCESALLASSTYALPSRGMEIASLPKDEVKSMLPEIKQQYDATMKDDGRKFAYGETIKELPEGYYIASADPREAGMELVQAYLKLNEKGKAIEVLRELSEKYRDTDFGNHCKSLLEILE